MNSWQPVSQFPDRSKRNLATDAQGSNSLPEAVKARLFRELHENHETIKVDAAQIDAFVAFIVANAAEVKACKKVNEDEVC